MLVSAVFVVRPLRAGFLPESVGRVIQGFFYNWLRQADTDLANSLHDRNGIKSYTVSNLCGGSGISSRPADLTQTEKTVIIEDAKTQMLEQEDGDELSEVDEGIAEIETPNTIQMASSTRPIYRPGRRDLWAVEINREYWFRITTYEAGLSKLFIQEILPKLVGEQCLFLELPFEIVKIITDPDEHLWAGTTSFESISSRQMLNPTPASRFTLRFSSPTTFNSKGHSMNFPLPDLVFGSLLYKWNENAPLSLDGEIRRYISECMHVQRYQLRTKVVNFEEFYEPGCIGFCEYFASNRDRYWLGLISTLVDFAFYCGIGHRTTMGLGQVHLLPSYKPIQSS